MPVTTRRQAALIATEFVKQREELKIGPQAVPVHCSFDEFHNLEVTYPTFPQWRKCREPMPDEVEAQVELYWKDRSDFIENSNVQVIQNNPELPKNYKVVTQYKTLPEDLKIVPTIAKIDHCREQGWLSKLTPPTPRKLALPDYGPHDLRKACISEMVYGDLFDHDLSNWPQDFWLKANFDTNLILDFLYRVKLTTLFPYQARYANTSEKVNVKLGCMVRCKEASLEMHREFVDMPNLDLSKDCRSVFTLEMKIANAFYDHFKPKGYASILIRSIAFQFADTYPDTTIWV